MPAKREVETGRKRECISEFMGYPAVPCGTKKLGWGVGCIAWIGLDWIGVPFYGKLFCLLKYFIPFARKEGRVVIVWWWVCR